MTISEWMEKSLYEQGLFEDEAAAIVARAKLKEWEVGAHLHCRWWDQIEAYPAVVHVTLLMAINIEAVQWIDANKPMHWARPMLALDQVT